MRKTLALTATAIAWATCAQAMSQEKGAYLGGAFGQTTFTIWCSSAPGSVITSCDDKDTGWKLFGGYRFNRYVAAEAVYMSWGKTSGSGTSSGVPFSVAADTSSKGVAAVGTLPLGHGFSAFAKIGYLFTDQERRGRTFDDEEYFRGFGATYALSRNWAIRGEWEKANQLKAEFLSMGAEFRF
jgi:OOP family OmpA-OmpF porin